MTQASAPQPAPAGRQQRRFRNYLLDRRFQLKYAGYFVGIAVLLSAVLGTVLWRTSVELLAQSHVVVDLGSAVVVEGKKVSQVVEMSIVKDAEYAENPELLAAFKDGDSQYTRKLEAQQQELERQAAALSAQHRTATIALLIALVAFVLVVGVAGIVVTHKVAGPVYKLRRRILEVSEGRLPQPSKLRRGDELVECFDAFEGMVKSLRERQEREIAQLDAGIEGLSATAEEVEPLRRLRDEMRASLEG